MTTDEIINYCLSKDSAYLDFPFEDIPICVKVANRLFAQIYPKAEDCKITLNCDMATGEFYRNIYPHTVVRGYHCPPVQQPYFNQDISKNFPPSTGCKIPEGSHRWTDIRKAQGYI